MGWFSEGGRPGGIGPTVLAGHVDSVTGPAVFDKLRQLNAGDVVTVTSSAGDSAHYRVETLGDLSKSDFPTVDVFGATSADRIRLITCSGDFDSAVGSYSRNLVAFGSRI
ncbi:class F sortase [Rhodococcus sp. G-MC3]|uniref:class F sortase n=1 Tax=Rhodococcus sp. G-MC3 TaxID=3046209 RepID=UPI0024B8A1A9|nr:class F sortase [Rhodococcus sp. G-MC3]MDJ0392166.1 class F sortase [Rhodococcus sp. G-MC3]